MCLGMYGSLGVIEDRWWRLKPIFLLKFLLQLVDDLIFLHVFGEQMVMTVLKCHFLIPEPEIALS